MFSRLCYFYTSSDFYFIYLIFRNYLLKHTHSTYMDLQLSVNANLKTKGTVKGTKLYQFGFYFKDTPVQRFSNIRIPWYLENLTFFKRSKNRVFYTHHSLSAIFSPFKFLQSSQWRLLIIIRKLVRTNVGSQWQPKFSISISPKYELRQS